jgi:potassium channel subfamily K, other eukaryote
MSTIDPGLGDSVQQTAQDVEGYPSDDTAQEEQEDEEESEFQDPSRWWFASTMSPLLAGTFGPLASGFSVCGLVWVWRVYIPPGGTEEHGIPIPDPVWLVVLNAVSLFFAVVGNASLLLNMTQRLRFAIAQPITIAGFFLAGILLIADIAAINGSPTYYLTGIDVAGANHALSPAYYYALWAAIFYMIIGFLMCFTVYGAHMGYYSKA